MRAGHASSPTNSTPSATRVQRRNAPSGISNLHISDCSNRRRRWSIFQEDQLEASMAGGARAASPENIKPRSTGSHVVYDMPLVLIHEDHKVPTVHPDTGTGTTETGNGGSERRNDPVSVRVADGVDSGLKVGEW